MKRLAGLAGAVALTALAACETTGNPSEGGLFGWSESKARERQANRTSPEPRRMRPFVSSSIPLPVSAPLL